ncbi:threonyl-tRNA synthetase [Desulfonispora thiosulfatigenes DSM 11270]|uniref:Threonine--tRNA ligase n=1 Tax=Desulfonispora thiosulfatigenes DSM 11270 TaxID=656914 RepID=A0A1W1VSF0_DESTI|nr:threonine--tRNA ligase [Desulfonispora thiosulfatigenes]SMB96021.1 threonyl-tRNA synthetase [Desulfonispora thiosulfatigenes DSM 11270]
MIKITLPDNSVREYENTEITPLDIANSISRGLAKKAVGAKVNDVVVGLDYVIKEDAQVAILTFDDLEGQHVFRHSSSHILAQAVKNLFPGTILGIGPSIKDGFYYDFDSEHKFTPLDLEKIEVEMNRIIKENKPFVRKELSRDEAITFFADKNEPYKVELINDLPEDAIISIYEQGDFVDLCAGPHVATTGVIKAPKLLSLAGAYWKGSEKNKMLQRIYGTSFPKKTDLEEHLFRIEEAKRRDHRKLGQELGLFTIMDEGPGFPFFYPKGMVLRNELENYWRELHKKNGYDEIKSPIILNRELWERSGHWDHYKDNMYFTEIDKNDFSIKPMNCPGGMLVYNSMLHSYRDLPIRLAELGLVHRHELSGALHGLMRVRAFTQDDAHIFMLPSQIKEEIKSVMNLIDEVYKLFGFDYHVELSTKPEKALGSDEIWEKAISALEEALKENDREYIVNEGDGAFYGPKIDFHLTDSLGRTWQCGTIQLDFQMPEKFDLTYIGEDGEKHRPVMIHRVVFGSIERFIGILTEHYAGAFPLWLSPVQVKILPISEKQISYCKELEKELKNANIRVEVDTRNEKIGYKIREAQLQKTPYMLIIGNREEESNTVGLRKRGEGDLGSVSFQEFKEKVISEVNEKNN